MSSVSKFKIGDQVVDVKDTAARNVDIRHARLAILGDSNAAQFFTSNVLQSRLPEMAIDSYATWGDSLLSGLDRQATLLHSAATPDYILVWFGNNDVRRGTSWGIPQFSVYGGFGSYTAGTSFGNLNNYLADLKTTFPRAQIIGVVINKPYDLEWSRWRFFFGTVCNIFKKHNLPVLNLNDTIGFSNYIPTQKSAFYADDLHYNEEGCKRIADKLIGMMLGGCQDTGEIEFNDVYVETPENIGSDPAKWIQWTGQFLQPFDGNPYRCSWAGTCTIHNLTDASQRIVASGTWYGYYDAAGADSYFRFFGLFRTRFDPTPHFYDTETGGNTTYLASAKTLTAGEDIRFVLKRNESVTISNTLLPQCPNAPTGFTSGTKSITVVPGLASNGYLNCLAWSDRGDFWTGYSAPGSTKITWTKFSGGGGNTPTPELPDNLMYYTVAQQNQSYNLLSILRNNTIFTCTGAQAANIPGLPDNASSWEIIPMKNSNGAMLCLAVGWGGQLYVGQALAGDTEITWFNKSTS